MQKENHKSVTSEVRALQPGDSFTVSLAQDQTIRSAPSRIMLYNPEFKIECRLDRKTRTITATRIK